MKQLQFTEKICAVAFQIEKQGNHICGDSFYMSATDDYFIAAIADGLGSGDAAKESSQAICRVVEDYQKEDVTKIFTYCNEIMKNKRGATVSIFKADFRLKQFTYSSVGNIRFVLYSPTGQYTYPVPVSGYLSGKPQKFRVQTFPYESGSKFIMHSDGLRVATIKSLLIDDGTVEETSQLLERYVPYRMDDLTYIVGQLQ